MESTQTIVINRIITTAIKRKATDLHLSVGNNPILRIDDKLYVLSDEDIITAEFINNLVGSLFDEKDLAELSKKLEITKVHDYGNQVRFRINVFYQKGFLNLSFRFVPAVIPTLRDIGVPKVFQDLVNSRRGLIIIGGGFDSGRTTTFVSFLEEINRTQRKYILSIESPTEFLISSNMSIVMQRDIPRDATSYEEALNYCEKEDFDIIMIDKLDNSGEVLIKAFELASSGKLVVGIVNAEGITGAIEKILASFSDKDRDRARILFSNALSCILVQKLVPKMGGGRVLVPEILLATEPVKATIKENRIYQLSNILQTSREEGMRGIDVALSELVSTGEISIDDALEYANNKDTFKLMMR